MGTLPVEYIRGSLLREWIQGKDGWEVLKRVDLPVVGKIGAQDMGKPEKIELKGKQRVSRRGFVCVRDGLGMGLKRVGFNTYVFWEPIEDVGKPEQIELKAKQRVPRRKRFVCVRDGMGMRLKRVGFNTYVFWEPIEIGAEIPVNSMRSIQETCQILFSGACFECGADIQCF